MEAGADTVQKVPRTTADDDSWDSTVPAEGCELFEERGFAG